MMRLKWISVHAMMESMMLSPLAGILFLVMYVVIVFTIASWVENKAARGVNIGNNAIIYTFSFAVWLTAWSFYGQVGRAAPSGMLYLTSHLGATLSIVLWWIVLRKMVRIRHAYRITSIADFISLRYNKSAAIAALATIIAIVGIVPYLALQLKAVIATFAIMVQSPVSSASSGSSWATDSVGIIIVTFMILFTIMFGARRIVPTESHQGMVVAMAAESFVKIAAFIAVGIFVTYFLFNGIDDIFNRFSASHLSDLFTTKSREAIVFPWLSNLVMAMSAVIFVPALFHIMVVENFHEKHIRTSMWLFPSLMFLINVFVLPIAMAGLLLGYPVSQADSFVLTLPFNFGKAWLSVFAFIGGFSSAMGMLVVNAVTLSTMFTNHILLPVLEFIKPIGFLKRYLLQCRWLAVVIFILASYWFEQTVVQYAMLADIGVFAFAAVLQFAPTIIGGLFWKKGNKIGALLGMGAGFAVWIYTLILPAFVKGGLIDAFILNEGPLGIYLLRPEHLFGVNGLDPTSNAILWTLLFNIGLYVLGSLYFEQSQDEQAIAEGFVTVLDHEKSSARTASGTAIIDLNEKMRIIVGLFSQFFTTDQANQMANQCISSLQLNNKDKLAIFELAELNSEVEKKLASSIGAAAAHYALQRSSVFSTSEEGILKQAYAEIMSELKLPPSELLTRIDYYRANEHLLTEHAKKLEETLSERDKEIAERLRIEKTLRDSERRLTDLINLLPDVTFAVDLQRNVIIWNLAAEEFTGVLGIDMLGKNNFEYALPFYNQRRPLLIDCVLDSEIDFRNSYVSFMRKGDLYFGEAYLNGIKGEAFVQAVAAPLYDSEGAIIGAIESIRDITERKYAEQELAQEKERLAVTLRSIGDGVITTDINGNVVLLNSVAEKMTGWKQDAAIGHPMSDIFRVLNNKTREQCQSPFESVIATGNFFELANHTILVSRDGSERSIANSGAPIRDSESRIIGAVLVFRDVTDKERMEAEFLRTQKLDSVGILAGGIAHDFNNILTSIIGNISLARMHAVPGEKISERLVEAEKASLRAKDLTQQLLTFSRGGSPIKKLTSLVEVIKDTANFAIRGADARCSFVLPDDLWPAEIDEGQISQVIHNMVINANQAMPGGGLITISAKNVDIMTASKLPLQPGRYICISIADTGIGLSAEHLDKIFDPYFTTKQMGSGLGLTSSYSIAKKHDGYITVESELGVGTTFNVYLPAVDTIYSKPVMGAEVTHSGNGTVLLMDDEETVREVASEMLGYLGYSVECASDGEKALSLYKKRLDAGKAFDVVITDLTIPGGMGGKETTRRLHEIDPLVRVIVSSGYSTDQVMAEYRQHGFCGIVTKPYKVADLGLALKDALAGN